MMQIGFCWIPLCFGLVWFLLDFPLLCLSCRLSHFHTLHSDKTVLTEVTSCPLAQEFELVVYPHHLVSHL